MSYATATTGRGQALDMPNSTRKDLSSVDSPLWVSVSGWLKKRGRVSSAMLRRADVPLHACRRC
jgi:hypothetical protein